ncbi:hypothetical protein B4U37_03440 [Sutcliffiella horikoshii]|uniref:Integral membrane protein n=1 Tax=Sutcliffiella horikoshii TaxID=79883 RepID=A0ABN4ZEV2_9BACI|nr:hypothetical protein [Sutcliffiella horikoshii]ART75153.1 hypothetical protein B4U37_03440 [Sutcliffiella horikoshii]
MDFVYLASITVAVFCMFVVVFQVLLSLGYPFGEFAMGGHFKVLPKRLRIVSALNALILVFMGLVFLQHTNVLTSLDFLSTHILVWIITIFLGFNTLANLVSRSKKERLFMTPLSGFIFILCLFISLA